MQLSRRHWWLLVLGIASVSFSGILAKWAQTEHVPSTVIAFWRLTFAVAMLLPFALARRLRHMPTVTRRDLYWMAFSGLLLALHFATWITSLEHTTVAASAVLVATESLWVPLGTWLLLREHVALRTWAGIAIAFGGTLLLFVAQAADATEAARRPLLGNTLAVVGAITASLYFLVGRRVRQRLDLLTYGVVVYSICAFLLLLAAGAQGHSLTGYSMKAYGVMFLFAFFPMILGHTVFNYLFRWVPPHYISTGILAEPVVTAALAVVIWQEPLPLLVALGGVVILMGILVAVGKKAQKET